ncbi:NADH-dependent flavin oxidoreductase nadA [Lachnellula arida]|uniref:NADH-dependent flavin oxidoreductase nadA n=1 Tax=Lachnellula arida TaxID=1316785 RepID=A0A8T9B897_9HELO|nr:NADH-dependent flavin oxidoreductase nadA [Lachnellula arida]
MTERLATWDKDDPNRSGISTLELVYLYRTWGNGDLGIIITGNIMIDRNHIEVPGNVILEDSSGGRIEKLNELVVAAQEHGSLCVAQLNHPGRQINSLLQPNPVSCSAIQLEGERVGMTFGKPTALTKAGISEIVEQFAESSRLCHKAGFDGVQLHAAHGYLIGQFLSKRTNIRTDEYNGSITNRARFLFEIVEAIKTKVDDARFSISVKLNSVEFMDGFTVEDCRDLCVQLQEAKVDFVELSGGTYEELEFSHKRESTIKREAFFFEFAKLITPALDEKKTLVYLTGGFRSSNASAPKENVPEPLSILASGINMTRIANGQVPLDLGSSEDIDRLLKAVGIWLEVAAANAKKGICLPGYCEVPDVRQDAVL